MTAFANTNEGPLVLLTGYSRGIGRATAIELARRGATLALWGRKSSAACEVVSAIRSEGGRLRCYEVDLEDEDAIERTIEELLDAQGTPDSVINNAAMIERCRIEEMSRSAWARQLAVNLRAPVVIVQGLLTPMRRRGSGRFVQVGSIASTVGTASASAYCASKWGLVGFTKSLAEEISNSGLSAVAILPGSVDTEMLVGSGFAPRMTALDVAKSICHYALDAPIAHNGAIIEMFGV